MAINKGTAATRIKDPLTGEEATLDLNNLGRYAVNNNSDSKLYFSDNTPVDNIGGAIKVVNAVNTDVNFQYKFRYLETNLNSNEMAINGSSTPVDFIYTATELSFIDRFSILLSDRGSSDITDYGSISGGVSNGTEIFTIINGVTNTASITMKNNIDFYEFFAENIVGSDDGGFSSDYLFVGSISFNHALKLEIGDQVVVRVNDNLTGLVTHRASIRVYEATL